MSRASDAAQAARVTAQLEAQAAAKRAAAAAADQEARQAAARRRIDQSVRRKGGSG